MEFKTATIFQENEISADIILCLKTLFSITAGTQPLDREFGINTDFIGKPTDVAMNEYTLEIVEKVKRYEPRVEVVSVDFEHDVFGLLKPIVHLRKKED